jgi:hypothetical protein
MARSNKRFDDDEGPWVIVVTYGTREDQVYAQTNDQDGADRLKTAAIEHGYRDARIESSGAFYGNRTRRRAAA